MIPLVSYDAFVASKHRRTHEMNVEYHSPHTMLFPFQRDLVAWALRKGSAAVFADCGLGKTIIQLEWARHFDRTLIVAPLGVGPQTIVEGAKIGLSVRLASPNDNDSGIMIVNYERLKHYVDMPLDAIVLDESSILKSIDGKTRTMLLEKFAPRIQHRLCCTATPAPNDIAELANHAEFIGAMRRVEMLATFFVHDDTGWRLKGHARKDFWKWVASWASFVRKPSDLGYEDGAFTLPSLAVRDEVVASTWRPAGTLFADIGSGIRGRLNARRGTIADRCEVAARIIKESRDQWLVWCGLNDEGDTLEKILGDECVQIAGADDEDAKISREREWREGKVQTLITKCKVFGFGMNFQHCHRMMFLGLGDSWEQYYQALRRCWRFGQVHPVEAIILISDAESGIAANVKRKEVEAMELADGVIEAMRVEQLAEVRGVGTIEVPSHEPKHAEGESWKMMLGDSVSRMHEIADGSVGLSVFSPPFASLYTYSSSNQDLGNCRDYEQFFEHFRYIIPELLRVTMPCRRACVHVQQVTMTQATHGVIGWYDFRADVVRAFVEAGWVYDGEVVIDKDPQAQAIRTHSKALLFVQKNKDSTWSRPAMADYILLFRAPGENPEPVKCDLTNEEWILWARPIWYDIRETETLNAAVARENDDERHICPLQLGTIERCVRLWSNPGDVVFDPFAGIGSTGFVALQRERRFVGCELKESYWKTACSNLAIARRQRELF